MDWTAICLIILLILIIVAIIYYYFIWHKSTVEGFDNYILPNVSNKLLLWYDASDSATLNTSGAVTEWKDKSGNNATMTPQLGSCSYSATGFNGKPSVNFNNSALKAQLNRGTFPSGSGISVLTAYYTTNGGGWGVPFTRSYNNLADPIDMYNASRWTGNAGNYSAYGSSIDLRNLNSPCIYDITVNAQGWNEWVNGGEKNWSTTFNVPFTDANSDKFFLGGRWDNVTYLNGFISETIVYAGILSTADRQTLEGYLAWKWGIQNTLPGSHPYKSAAPPGSVNNTNTGGGSNGKPGLIWTSYDGYHNENPAIKLNPRNGNGGTSTGIVTDFNNLATSTQNNFPPNQNNHNFTVIWNGYLFTQGYGGVWKFQINSDDGSYIWIGDAAKSGYARNNALIDNGDPHGMQNKSANVELKANTYYPIRMMFGEIGGGYDFLLRFTPPGKGDMYDGTGFFFTEPPTILPSNAISINNFNFAAPSAPAGGWSGSYINTVPKWDITSGTAGIVSLVKSGGPWGFKTSSEIDQYIAIQCPVNFALSQNVTLKANTVYEVFFYAAIRAPYYQENIDFSVKVNGVSCFTRTFTSGDAEWTKFNSSTFTIPKDGTVPLSLCFNCSGKKDTSLGITNVMILASTNQSLNSYISDYIFRIKPTSSSLPSTDIDGFLSVKNNGGVVCVQDPLATRGFVFQFNGSNYLSVSTATPVTSTRTFWVYTTTPSANNGNCFSSQNYPIWFSGTTKLHAALNFNAGGGVTVESPTPQPASWTFYAITTTATEITMYINGNSTPVVQGTLGNFIGDRQDIQFGAYMNGNNLTGYLDDMRQYSRVLTPTEINEVYYDVITSSGDGKRFSPSTFPGMVLWLDAMDPVNNGSPASNGNIAKWVDKSGNGNDGSASAGVEYNTTGLNGKPTFDFKGPGDPNKFFVGKTNVSGDKMTIFAICSMNQSSPFAARVLGLSNGAGVNDFPDQRFVGILRQSGTGLGPYRAGNYIRNDSTTAYSTPYVWETWYDGGTQYSAALTGSNTTINKAGCNGNFAINYYAVGNNPNLGDMGAAAMNGQISEIIVYNTCLTDDQRQQVESYLSWKWGLQDKLPSNNPYKSASPFAISNQPAKTGFVTNDIILSLDPDTGITDGKTWKDTSPSKFDYLAYVGNGTNNITPTSAVSYVTTQFNGTNVVVFDSTKSNFAYNATGFPSSQFLTNGYTYDMWIYPIGSKINGTTGASYNAMILMENGQAGAIPANGWCDTHIAIINGYVCTGFWNGGAKGYVKSNSVINLNTWYHIVETWDAKTQVLSQYLNGVLQTNNPNGTKFVRQDPGTIWLTLGIWFNAGYFDAPATQPYFNGYMGPVNFYSRPLTANEALQNYVTQLNRYVVPHAASPAPSLPPLPAPVPVPVPAPVPAPAPAPVPVPLPAAAAARVPIPPAPAPIPPAPVPIPPAPVPIPPAPAPIPPAPAPIPPAPVPIPPAPVPAPVSSGIIGSSYVNDLMKEMQDIKNKLYEYTHPGGSGSDPDFVGSGKMPDGHKFTLSEIDSGTTSFSIFG